MQSMNPRVVVDVHTHLFNANFLPLYSVLKKWVSGTWADLAQRYIEGRVDRCEGGGNPMAFSDDRDFEDILSDDDEELIEQLYDPVAAETLRTEDAQFALSSLATAYPRSFSLDNDAPPEFHALFNEVADERPRDIFPERGGFLQWIRLMTWCEKKIWAAVQHYYPDVQLFVAHMMDMEHYYDPHVRPVYAWPDEQLRRMRDLMDASEGKLLTFVAFDPKRDDWREIVEKGIAHGCIGVKFYPPSGYAPFDEAAGDFPNANTRNFFLYCEERGIPVFTHCTQGGFEAIGGYGIRFGHPRLWGHVLARVPNLRLCFGHAGGEPGWFKNVKENDPNFPAEVLKLCASYPNVYAEAGYLEDVLDSDDHPAFLARLQTALPSVGNKLMYGSDWHMIHRMKKHAGYLMAWKNMLSTPEWDSFRDNFFYRNAIQWLDLPSHIARQERAGRIVTPEARAHWQSLMA
jgi:predicted TIM-barrel fold metal-dependent hydrolase